MVRKVSYVYNIQNRGSRLIEDYEEEGDRGLTYRILVNLEREGWMTQRDLMSRIRPRPNLEDLREELETLVDMGAIDRERS